MNLEIEPELISQIILMGHELERAEPELRGLIDRLSEDEQAELISVTWIGRGSFEAEDWGEALATALNEASTPCSDYLIGTPHFPDHLEAGAEALGIELDPEAGVSL